MSPKLQNNQLKSLLQQLGLTEEEALIFMTLQEGSKTPLIINRVTGISRTTVYRIIEDLRAKSLVRVSVDDRGGKHIEAAEPAILEALLVDQEVALARQRSVLDETMHMLQTVRGEAPASSFKVVTFEGSAGLKQMLWNELKTKGEICIFSTDETLASAAGARWAEKYRALITERKISCRSLENSDARHALEETKVIAYKDYYKVRYLPREALDIQQELTIHDDIVSIYNWNVDSEEVKIGVEIHNKKYAEFLKKVFETYWVLAKLPGL